MKAKIRGTEIYYDIAGMQLAPAGKVFVERPVLFMLHGGPGGDHLRFKQHSLELQETAQLVLIDHRGCGRSKKTKDSEYTLENNIEDIEALRKHLCLKQICILGTSYGGIVAQGYAIRYPKNLQKLILVATAPSYQFISEAQHILLKQGTPQQIKWGERLWKGSFKNPRQVRDFFKVMENLYSKKSKKTTTKSSTIWSHQALNKGFGEFLRHYDFRKKLKKITCPTLVLAGKEDWICPPSQAKEITKYIAHAQLKIFNRCGHSIAIDAHRQYIQGIKKFLKSLVKV